MQEEMQQSESGSCKEKSILQSKPKSKPNDPFVNKAIAVINENIANYEFGKEEFAAAMRLYQNGTHEPCTQTSAIRPVYSNRGQ